MKDLSNTEPAPQTLFVNAAIEGLSNAVRESTRPVRKRVTWVHNYLQYGILEGKILPPITFPRYSLFQVTTWIGPTCVWAPIVAPLVDG